MTPLRELLSNLDHLLDGKSEEARIKVFRRLLRNKDVRRLVELIFKRLDKPNLIDPIYLPNGIVAKMDLVNNQLELTQSGNKIVFNDVAANKVMGLISDINEVYSFLYFIRNGGNDDRD